MKCRRLQQNHWNRKKVTMIQTITLNDVGHKMTDDTIHIIDTLYQVQKLYQVTNVDATIKYAMNGLTTLYFPTKYHQMLNDKAVYHFVTFILNTMTIKSWRILVHMKKAGLLNE